MKLSYDIVHFGSYVNNSLSPIIFIHGMGLWRKSWMVVGPRIGYRTRRKAYALDARNHGDSPWSDHCGVDTMVEDLLEFMNDHGILRAVLVGHSMGGRTAICFALKYPIRVESLVVEDMVPSSVQTKDFFVHRSFKALKNELASAIADMEEEEARKSLVDMILAFAPEKLLNHERIRSKFVLDMLPVRKVKDKCVWLFCADALLSMLEGNFLDQHLPEQGSIFEGRTLFVYGSKPFFKVKTDKTVSELFPHSVHKEIPGASHFLHLEFPDEYVDVVSEFILTPELSISKY